MSRPLWVPLILGSLLLACAGPGGPTRIASEEEQRAYDASVASLPGDPETASSDLERFLRTWPNSPLGDDAAEKLAAIALVAGDEEEAIRWLRYLLRYYPTEDRSDATRLNLSRMEVRRGDDREAYRVLAPIRFSRLSEEEQRSAYRMLARLAPDHVEEMRWLAQLRQSTRSDPFGVERVDRRIDALLGEMSTSDLERAAEQLGRRIPAGRARLRLAKRALEAGAFDRSADELSRADRLDLTPTDERLLETLRHQLELSDRIASAIDQLPTFAEVSRLSPPRTTGATGTIGVVLPLTGPYSDYAQESLRGVLLAARVFDPAPRSVATPKVVGDSVRRPLTGVDAGPPPEPDFHAATRSSFVSSGVRILIRDTHGTSEGAAQAVQALAQEDDLVAIVGPMLRDETLAAADAAERVGVPLIALSSRDEIPVGRSYVFRIRTTPADQVRHLVEHAVDVVGAQRFAILYPQDNYGRGMRDRFWQAVEERGGYVVAAAGYDSDATDFADAIRRMIGYVLLTEAEERALEERADLLRRGRRLAPENAAIVRQVAYTILGPEGQPLPPIVDFDALFIPDSHDKVVLIAPQLAFHEVSDVLLLGPDGWHDQELLEIARKHVRGAVISTMFDPESRFPFARDFASRYVATFGSLPDSFSAHAFDATNLVLVQLAVGSDSRSEVRDGLLEVRAFPGASGVTTVLPDGNARKRPYLLRAQRSHFESLD